MRERFKVAKETGHATGHACVHSEAIPSRSAPVSYAASITCTAVSYAASTSEGTLTTTDGKANKGERLLIPQAEGVKVFTVD